jgi:hypothetical protein
MVAQPSVLKLAPTIVSLCSVHSKMCQETMCTYVERDSHLMVLDSI